MGYVALVAPTHSAARLPPPRGPVARRRGNRRWQWGQPRPPGKGFIRRGKTTHKEVDPTNHDVGP